MKEHIEISKMKIFIVVFFFTLSTLNCFAQEYYSFRNLGEVESKALKVTLSKIDEYIQSNNKMINNINNDDSIASLQMQNNEKEYEKSNILKKIGDLLSKLLVAGNFNFNPNASTTENTITPEVTANYSEDGNLFNKKTLFFKWGVNGKIQLPINTNDSSTALFHIFKAGSDLNVELQGKIGYVSKSSVLAFVLGGNLKVNHLFSREINSTINKAFWYASFAGLAGVKLGPFVVALNSEFNMVKGDKSHFLKENLENSNSNTLYFGVGTNTFQCQVKYLLGSSKGVESNNVPEIKLGVTYPLL